MKRNEKYYCTLECTSSLFVIIRNHKNTMIFAFIWERGGRFCSCTCTIFNRSSVSTLCVYVVEIDKSLCLTPLRIIICFHTSHLNHLQLLRLLSPAWNSKNSMSWGTYGNPFRAPSMYNCTHTYIFFISTDIRILHDSRNTKNDFVFQLAF